MADRGKSMSGDMLCALTSVMAGIIQNSNNELARQTESDLESYWFFRWSPTKSIEANLYEFTKMLDLYRHHCRRWEEMHNGSCCVVERVRDKYLMPKIQDFVTKLAEALGKG